MSDSCGDAGRWSMSGSHVLANQLINKRRGKAEEREGEYQEEEDKKKEEDMEKEEEEVNL